MNGTTLHTGGGMGVGQQHVTNLNHTDVDVLFTRNQHLRWLLVDDVGMIPDDLLGQLSTNFTDAATKSRYMTRFDKSTRSFGGYNVLTFGDMYQIPPIPSTSSICIPPRAKVSEHGKVALNLFWGSDADSLNYFQELTIQKRVQNDPWYVAVLDECRYGSLTPENYNYIHGLPTLHTGSWTRAHGVACKMARCEALPNEWKRMAAAGAAWTEMQSMECEACQKERARRNRLLAPSDKRVTQPPFVDAPYIHKNNEPKYHAMLLRAKENAKINRKHALWFAAHDTPANPAQIVKKPSKLKERLERFLQFHDQKTCGIPGLNILYEGLRVRVTEKLVKNGNLTILKHTPCTVVGWELHPADRRQCSGPERFLNYMPCCIYLKFDNVTWEIHPKLGQGVFPLYPVERTWILNEATEAKIRRKGFTIVPDYASTAFMMQGATLKACLADCGDVLDLPGLSELMTTYVILSRATTADGPQKIHWKPNRLASNSFRNRAHYLEM